MVFIFAEAELEWQLRWFCRPNQFEMNVEEYYARFRDWKEEMVRLPFPAEESDYIDGFIEGFRWDLRFRLSKSRHRRNWSRLSDVFNAAKFEESMMLLEVAIKRFEAHGVFDKMPSQISGVNFHTDDLMNSACNMFDEIAEPNPTELQSTDTYNKPLDINAETIEDVKDVREELSSVKVDDIPENSAYQVFNEMPKPVSTDFPSSYHHCLRERAAVHDCKFLGNVVEEPLSLHVRSVEAARDEKEERTPTSLQSASQNIVKIAAHKVFDELTKPVPTEAGEPHLLTMASLKAVRHLFDEMPELTSVEQDKGCELNISYSYLMLVPKLDIEFLLGAISRFVFDPGGSFLYQKGCHSLKSGGDKYDSDFCSGELNTGPGCTSIDNALKTESIVVSSLSSKTRLHIAATSFPILCLIYVQTNWPTVELCIVSYIGCMWHKFVEGIQLDGVLDYVRHVHVELIVVYVRNGDQDKIMRYIFYICIYGVQDKDSEAIVAYISDERLMLPVVDCPRVWGFKDEKLSRCTVASWNAQNDAPAATTKSFKGQEMLAPFVLHTNCQYYWRHHLPSFVSLAKALSSAYIPIGANLVILEVADVLFHLVSSAVEDCSLIINVENFIWDPGWCAICYASLGTRMILRGRKRDGTEEIMRYDNRLSKDITISIIRRNEENEDSWRDSWRAKPFVAYFVICFVFCFSVSLRYVSVLFLFHFLEDKEILKGEVMSGT